MLYYLDSSAWVKRYFDEAGSGQVRNLFVQRDILGCSPLGLIEVGSTLARKRTAGEVRPAEFGPKRTSLLESIASKMGARRGAKRGLRTSACDGTWWSCLHAAATIRACAWWFRSAPSSPIPLKPSIT